MNIDTISKIYHRKLNIVIGFILTYTRLVGHRPSVLYLMVSLECPYELIAQAFEKVDIVLGKPN